MHAQNKPHSITRHPRSTIRIGKIFASGHPTVCQISAAWLERSPTGRTPSQNRFSLVLAAPRPARDRRPQRIKVHHWGHRVSGVAHFARGPVGLWPWLINSADPRSSARCTCHVRPAVSGPAPLSVRRTGPSPLKVSRRSVQPFARHGGTTATE